jgi:hypothetical protein
VRRPFASLWLIGFAACAGLRDTPTEPGFARSAATSLGEPVSVCHRAEGGGRPLEVAANPD